MEMRQIVNLIGVRIECFLQVKFVKGIGFPLYSRYMETNSDSQLWFHMRKGLDQSCRVCPMLTPIKDVA